MRPQTRSAYPANWPQVRQELLETRGHRCESCGHDGKTQLWGSECYNNPLTIHHIDYNPANNDPENLISLCAACHLRLQQYELAFFHKWGCILSKIAAGQLPLFPLDIPRVNSYESRKE